MPLKIAVLKVPDLMNQVLVQMCNLGLHVKKFNLRHALRKFDKLISVFNHLQITHILTK